MPIPAASRPHEAKLTGLNWPAALFMGALLRDVKVATMPGLVATVGTTSVQVLGTQNARVYTQIVNVSDTRIFLAFGEDAVLNQGAPIEPGGGVFEINWYNLWSGAINGISSGDAKKLSIIDGRT